MSPRYRSHFETRVPSPQTVSCLLPIEISLDVQSSVGTKARQESLPCPTSRSTAGAQGQFA
jgi:hypothetical protein